MSPAPAAVPPRGGGRHYDYAGALAKRMDERGVGPVSLAEAVSVSRQSIRGYLEGRWLPSTPVALAIAEALDYLPLYGIVLRSRRSTCAQCDRPLISNGSAHQRRWCNSTCRDRFRRGGAPRQSAEQVAIIRRCQQCEPLGTCYDARSALRRFSPLHLGRDAITPVATPTAAARLARWTPERRHAQSERMRGIHAVRRSVRVA